MENKKRIIVDVDEGVHSALKQKVAKERTTIKAVLVQFIKNYSKDYRNGK